MKRIEFKSIDLASVFKLFAGMSFVIGFIVGLFGGGFGGEQLQHQLRNVPFIGSMLNGFIGAILFGLFSAVVSGLALCLQAVLYNVFAMIFGGIEIDIDDK
ncbi:MAG: DUF3566 domain-containing protein [Candidatus Omnitrophica bacterium]|nr:DUF3566 domain-containing protein [Candidatus Omnitrophota bacterium]